MKKICVVTGSRAEYSLLYWLLKDLQEDNQVDFQLVVACMHLSTAFGSTYQCIESDGFEISAFVDMLLVGDRADSMSKSVGIGIMGFTEAFSRLKPDIIVVLGDRFEILAAAIAARILQIPVAHIHGGEVTEGALDESFRHAITKLSMVHFTSTESYRHRVIQLGEKPENVYNTGALGVDNTKLFSLLTVEELGKKYQFDFSDPYFLVTYHSETADIGNLEESIGDLLSVLDKFSDYKIVFTKANADYGGAFINQKIQEYVSLHPQRSVLYANLGTVDYLSVLKYASVVIGNSSSGIIEAPALKTPTVNIGNRQKGRLQDPSVIDCDQTVISINSAITLALDKNFLKRAFSSPSVYAGSGGEGTVAKRIVAIIKNIKFGSMAKAFYDLGRE